jgi:choline kinase
MAILIPVNINHIILSAGAPFSGNYQTALRRVGVDRRLLDWTLGAISLLQARIILVCGYQADEFYKAYPELVFRENHEWQSTRSGWSLLLGLPEDDRECTVSYGDILFRQEAVNELVKTSADVVVAIDSHWKTRFAGRNQYDMERCEKACLVSDVVTRMGAGLPVDQATAEFIGLVRLSARAVAMLRDLRHSVNSDMAFLHKASLPDLLEVLRMRGLSVRAVDVCGDWAELNEPADLAHFVLGTKAQTLARLQSMIKHARIEDQVSFTVGEWRRRPSQWVSSIQTQLGCGRVVVRSSALSEDGFGNSNAGAYTSLLDVDLKSIKNISTAIEKVIASYPDGNLENEVLVQPMLNGILASGVVFTRTLAQGAPYYVINYDDVSGSTESITSGSSKEHKTLVIRRDANEDSDVIPTKLSTLLHALREIEALLGYDTLDIEFAVTQEAGLHILQVRPIAVDHSGWGDADTRVFSLLRQADARFLEKQEASPFVCGQRTIFGIMPDWNPAEIIGTKPGQLAVSLYRSLITDQVWATQRAEYGYRDVRPHPLLVSFAGHPYVDVRASFNSFLPAELSDHLATKIINFCLDWLEANPELHDKVEFDVIPTCFSLNFDRWEAHFGELAGLTKEELGQWREALKGITVRGMVRNAADLASIGLLERRFEAFCSSDLLPLDKAFALLDDARHYGTLPFAHLARNAFIAVTLLRSAVVAGVLSHDEMGTFLSSIRTVSHAYTLDARACAHGDLPWSEFVDRYGHLRPGTYDITSQSYGQNPERYLRPAVEQVVNPAHLYEQSKNNALDWESARVRFTEALNASGVPGTVDEIERFLRQAIEGREYAKFAFTRNLSAALDAICEWGTTIGVKPEVLAEIGIEDLRALQSGQIVTTDVYQWLMDLATRAGAQRKVVEALEMPPLLCKREDFVVFQYPVTQANFVGGKPIVAPCVDLDVLGTDCDLVGMIILIPQADPGYDWLFGRRIGGLITMYGGANSHMAIRAAEFGLPAAIGVGEVRYRALAAAKELELDPVNRMMRIVH